MNMGESRNNFSQAKRTTLNEVGVSPQGCLDISPWGYDSEQPCVLKSLQVERIAIPKKSFEVKKNKAYELRQDLIRRKHMRTISNPEEPIPPTNRLYKINSLLYKNDRKHGKEARNYSLNAKRLWSGVFGRLLTKKLSLNKQNLQKGAEQASRVVNCLSTKKVFRMSLQPRGEEGSAYLNELVRLKQVNLQKYYEISDFE